MEYRSYLNPKGVIPPSATYKKGENPEKTRATNADAAAQAPSAEVAPPSDDEEGLAGDDE